MSTYFRVESQFLLNVIEIDLLILLSSYTSKSLINILGKSGNFGLMCGTRPLRFQTVASMVKSLSHGDSLLLDVALQLPLDARVRAERVVHDEVVQNLHPGGVLRQVVVVFRCNLLHLGMRPATQEQNLYIHGLRTNCATAETTEDKREKKKSRAA